jgi:hypothetical protein
VYRLTLITCRNRNWLHVGSSPAASTLLGQSINGDAPDF